MRLLLPTKKANEKELVFRHGGMIKVTSQSFLGGTFQHIHASEFAEYRDIKGAAKHLFQMAGPNAQVIIETTAHGMNEAYYLWMGKAQENMPQAPFHKRFLWWGLGDDYQADPIRGSLTAEEADYQAQNNLSDQQIGWVRQTLHTKCLGDWALFNQMYPASPDLAFITSGTPFFTRRFHNVILPKTQEPLLRYPGGFPNDRNPRGSYILGVDTASGSTADDADYHAAVLIDATNPNAMRVVATIQTQGPILDYAEMILDLAKEFTALAVIEVNSYGLTVQTHLEEAGYLWLYRARTPKRLGSKWANEIGWTTTRSSRGSMLADMQYALTYGKLDIPCPRLRAECNAFVYNKKAKPEAAKGQHDDLVMACALALQGVDQMKAVETMVRYAKRPRTNREILEWELQTGRIYKAEEHYGDDEPYYGPPGPVLAEMLPGRPITNLS
jgi:hypothetical protein